MSIRINTPIVFFGPNAFIPTPIKHGGGRIGLYRGLLLETRPEGQVSIGTYLYRARDVPLRFRQNLRIVNRRCREIFKAMLTAHAHPLRIRDHGKKNWTIRIFLFHLVYVRIRARRPFPFLAKIANRLRRFKGMNGNLESLQQGENRPWVPLKGKTRNLKNCVYHLNEPFPFKRTFSFKGIRRRAAFAAIPVWQLNRESL